MTYKVLLFASLRETFNCPTIELSSETKITGHQLLNKLVEKKPEIADQKKYLKISVNGTYSNLDQVIPQDSEIAVFPPVSGG